MELDKKISVVYDLETLSNCFTYTGINILTEEVYKFVIWEEINDFYPLLLHLSNCKGMIGFNSLSFDYPLIHYIIKNKDLLIKLSAKQIAKKLYNEAQRLIQNEYNIIKDEDTFIPQLDLFKLWHFDSKARITGLKKLEVNMEFENVQDMPINHQDKVKTKEQIEEILSYNLNDVIATFKFYKISENKIELRRMLTRKYGINFMNFSNSKMGEQLLLELYCNATNKDKNKVRKLRTHRNNFKFSECIPNYVKFTTPKFNDLLEYLKGIEVTSLKDSFHYELDFQSSQIIMGTGGIHFCVKSGIYKPKQNFLFRDSDVNSLYPSLGIANYLYPEHLGEEFYIVYKEGIVDVRLTEKAKKEKGDKAIVNGYKEAANAAYGKSNSEFSFLYDPLYTIKTTLAGQLSLCMLAEQLTERIPNLIVTQINTDGLTCAYHEKYNIIYDKVCEEWEKTTNLTLEHVYYDQMIIRDVNSYIGVYTDGKVKYKGTFKPNHEMRKDEEYHKNFSQNAVTLAISDYFLKNIPIEESLKNNKNIYDFCKTFNATHGWGCETVDSEGITQKQQKTNRYYISTDGKTFRKFKDERIIEIEAGGTKVTIFNKYEEKPFGEYNINYDYYVTECEKIIHKIDGTEERLEQERKELREKAKRDKEEENYLKFIINKVPTQLQYNTYWRDHCAIKYGEPKEIKPLKVKNLT